VVDGATDGEADADGETEVAFAVLGEPPPLEHAVSNTVRAAVVINEGRMVSLLVRASSGGRADAVRGGYPLTHQRIPTPNFLSVNR
jgi:hypothetical protein